MHCDLRTQSMHFRSDFEKYRNTNVMNVIVSKITGDKFKKNKLK